MRASGQLAGTFKHLIGYRSRSAVVRISVGRAAHRCGRRDRAAVAGPVQRAITIAVTPERAYTFWRELQNLPGFRW